MITIVAKCVVKEGKTQEFLDLASPLVEMSQAEEGCISYNLYQDLEDPRVLTFIEEWKDEKAIKTHNETTHFTETVPKLGDLMGESEVRHYVIVK